MKKIVFKVMKVIFVFVLFILFVGHNIKSNSVYYAQNMPYGEGRYPELVMLIENLGDIYVPSQAGLETDIPFIHGDNSVKNTKGTAYFIVDYSDDGETEYVFSEHKIHYRFNRKFDLVHVIGEKSIDVSSVNKNQVIAELKEFLKPIIDKQRKPALNLQWLFNYLYQETFK